MSGTGGRLREAAVALLDSLDDAQRAEMSFELDDDDERRNWFYWPGERRGLSFGDMTREQRKLAHAIVSATLSLPAYAKVTAIIALEEVLGRIEGGPSRRGFDRDSTLYFTSLFGDPAGDEPWGWRFEGHHVSLHATVAGEDVAPTPLFLGANPARVEMASAPLYEEEMMGRLLIEQLSPELQRKAIIDDKAPDDILTRNAPRIDDPPDGGVPLSQLSGEAAELASELVRLYVTRLPDDRAGPALARLAPTLGDTRFAWAGSLQPGEGHYYRLAGPRLLIEYDNTQDGANHIHTVWRDRESDFGEDLLRRHLAEHHDASGGFAAPPGAPAPGSSERRGPQPRRRP